MAEKEKLPFGFFNENKKMLTSQHLWCIIMSATDVDRPASCESLKKTGKPAAQRR
jgi:hypothetical protein